VAVAGSEVGTDVGVATGSVVESGVEVGATVGDGGGGCTVSCVEVGFCNSDTVARVGPTDCSVDEQLINTNISDNPAARMMNGAYLIHINFEERRLL
jgi:hypothetical protein